ncbi:MAG: hypothetical protein JWP81_2238 [Ferruginibacter sp.]|nr:hypothetical protein [Ferruginibacter sp.]
MVAMVLCFFFSCSSRTNRQASENIIDSAHTQMQAPVAPHKPGNELIIRHKVINFAKWRKEYESQDSIHRLHGLTKYLLGRGMSDSNIVIAILKMDDVKNAKEFMDFYGTKAYMKKSRVMGRPRIIYLDRIMHDSTKVEQNARLMVDYEVKNWDSWKKEFDKDRQSRLEAGLKDRGLGYSFGDNHLVTSIFAVTDVQKATAFLKSPVLKQKMARAGVEGPPGFFFYNIVQKY